MTHRIPIWLFVCMVALPVVLGAIMAGCSKPSPQPQALASSNNAAAPSSAPFSVEQRRVVVPANKGQLSPSSYNLSFSTNQKLLEGYYSKPLDERDVDAMFWAVFSQLPEEVVVYPSENYYYFILGINGHQLWGNIRLPSGRRELGELSFAYFEYDEFAYVQGPQFSRAKMFTASDGVMVKELDRFSYAVTYKGKSVTFNFLRLPQDPPRLFKLGQDEVFVMRTFDESGFQFFLLFNEAKKYFFWVLNEEDGVPDTLDLFGNSDDIYRGRRSGFIFWEDLRHDGRKVLVSVRQQSVERNDYFDGPFDQLADNYADETKISEYIGKASPSLAGKVDKYGYFLEFNPGMRVALSMYYSHYYDSQVLEFIRSMRGSDDPYWYISRRGLPPYTGPVITPVPSAAPRPPSAP